MGFFKTPSETPAEESPVAIYTVDEGINNEKVTYQDSDGAPIESRSPLGYSVGWITVVFLNVSMMIGTGVFSTRRRIIPFF